MSLLIIKRIKKYLKLYTNRFSHDLVTMMFELFEAIFNFYVKAVLISHPN